MSNRTDKNNKIHRSWRKRLRSALAIAVVFITAYALILPAITLERDVAKEDPGIVLEQTAGNDGADTVAAGDISSMAIGSNTDLSAIHTSDVTTAQQDNAEIRVNTSDANQTEASVLNTETADINMSHLIFEEKTDDVKVVVEAEEGALPEGTTMKLTPVDDKETLDKITEAVDDEIAEILATDIQFTDKDGNEIEPQKPIRVTMTSELLKESEDPVIVHVDDKGKAEIVKLLDEKQLEELNIVPEEDEVVFEAEKFSVYAIVKKAVETPSLTAEGDNWQMFVKYGPDAEIPDGAELSVEEILPADASYNLYVQKAADAIQMENELISFAQLMDIKILKEGEEVHPAAPVEVSIRMLDDSTVASEENEEKVSFDDIEKYVLHFAGTAEILDAEFTEDKDGTSQVVFDTAEFSPFGIVSVRATEDQETTAPVIKPNALAKVPSNTNDTAVAASDTIHDFSVSVFYGGRIQPVSKYYTWNTETSSWDTVTNDPAKSGYVWTARSSAKDHHFNYRVSFGLGSEESGSGDVFKIGTVSFTIPTHLIRNRNGEYADKMDFSIPSKEEVEEAIAAGENLAGDISFWYYEDPDDPSKYIVENFRDVDPGFDGYIEFSYITTESTFNYVDLSQSDPFVVEMQAVDPANGGIAAASGSADPVYIDTQVELLSSEIRIPTKYDKWQSSWGTPDTIKIVNADGTTQEISGEDLMTPGKYTFFVWEIRSRINDNSQKYDFTIEDFMSKLLADGNAVTDPTKAFVAGYKFNGTSNFVQTNTKEGETTNDLRYDYVLTAFDSAYWTDVDNWKITNEVELTVHPHDGNDPDSTNHASRTFTWNKPHFNGNAGGFGIWLRADGFYRYQAGREQTPLVYMTGLGMVAGNYSRYDLNTLKEAADKNEPASLGDLDYAVYAQGYAAKWTVDTEMTPDQMADKYLSTHNNVLPSGIEDRGALIRAIQSDDDNTYTYLKYFEKPIRYVVTDDEFYLSDENDGVSTAADDRLTSSEDYQIDKLRFSIGLSDGAYNTSTATFGGTSHITNYMTANVDGDEKNYEPVWFYVKTESTDSEWKAVGRYDVVTKTWNDIDGKSTINSDYVKSFDASTLVFADNANVVGYKLETLNKHYHTSMSMVPTLSLKNSERVVGLIKESTDSLALNNRMTSTIYDYKSEADASAENIGSDLPYTHRVWGTGYYSDADFIRKVEKTSNLDKEVVSVTNTARKKQYSVGWHVTFNESFKYGQDETGYVEQNNGIFYDLLPMGATLDADSILVQTEKGEVLSNSYDVEQFNDHKHSGRTLVKISIFTDPAERYELYYNTIHTYESLRDYSNYIYNSIAYETGNTELAGGFPDNGGVTTDGKTPFDDISTFSDLPKDYYSVGTEAEYMSGLIAATTKDDSTQTANRFVYAGRYYDVASISAAASGLVKKVRSTGVYTNEALTESDGEYSYMLRFQNSFANKARHIVLMDSLESFKTKDGRPSDWTGTIKSIDLSAIPTEVDVIIYLSKENISINKNTADTLSDETTWDRYTRSELQNLSSERLNAYHTIAIDLSTSTKQIEREIVDENENKIGTEYGWYTVSNGKESDTEYYAEGIDKTSDGYLPDKRYTLEEGESLTIIVNMIAPHGAARYQLDAEGKPVEEDNGQYKIEKGYPMAYNNVYARYDRITFSGIEYDKMINQGYTTTSLLVTANINIKKISSEDGSPVRNIRFQLSGESDYGTEVKMTALSNSSGVVRFQRLEKGTYTLREIEATPDWQGDYETVYTVKIDEEGRITIKDKEGTEHEYARSAGEATVEKPLYFEIENDPRVHTDLRFYKRRALTEEDTSAVSIQGVTFRLSGISDYGNEILKDATSQVPIIGGMPNVTISDIEQGTYTLEEIETNPEYLLSDVKYRVVVDASAHASVYEPVRDVDGSYLRDEEGEFVYDLTNENTIVDMDGLYPILYNYPKYHDLSIRKVDTDNLSRYLEGATFELSGGNFTVEETTADDEGNITTTTKTVTSLTADSDANGKVTFKHIEAGTYVLQETKAPTGVNADGQIPRDENGNPDGTGKLNYLADSNKYVVVVAEDGTVTIDGLDKDVTGLYRVRNGRAMSGEIIVYKQWEDDADNDNRPIPEITMTVNDPESATIRGITVVKQWSGDTDAIRGAAVGDDLENLEFTLYRQSPTIAEGKYTRVEYIENKSKAYIDLGLPLKDNLYEIRTGFMSTQKQSGYATVYANRGERNKYPLIYRTFLYGNNMEFNSWNHASNPDIIGPAYSHNTYYEIVQNANETVVRNENGAEIGRYPTNGVTGNDTTDANLLLFQQWGSEFFKGRMYYFQLWHDGEIVMDLIPVVTNETNTTDGTGVYGMYDMIGQKFYPSKSSTAFTGAAVTAAEPVAIRNTTDNAGTVHWTKVGDVWTATFTDIIVDGSYAYYVAETKVPDKYSSSADGTSEPLKHLVTVSGGKAIITNTHDSLGKDFAFTGNVQQYTAPASGYYQLEVWGADGGNDNPNWWKKLGGEGVGGDGGYSRGVIYLSAGDSLHVIVGGAGETKANKTNSGGYNGGGDAGNSGSSGGGGGMTHVSWVENVVDRNENNPWDPTGTIIVAGGGGGAGNGNSNGTSVARGNEGGAGGGLTAGAGFKGDATPVVAGATQTEGYRQGQGQDRVDSGGENDGGGGGAGWYGGCTSSSKLDTFGRKNGDNGAAGGSGYVAIGSITVDGSQKNGLEAGAITIAGNDSNIPVNPNGQRVRDSGSAKSRNGYARITFIDEKSSEEVTLPTGGDESSVTPTYSYQTNADGWVQEGDTWRYVFHVFNDDAAFTLTELIGDGHAVTTYGYTVDQEVISIDGHTQKSVVFTNSKKSSFGSLTIDKSVLKAVNAEGDTEDISSTQEFTFTLQLSGEKIHKTGQQVLGGVPYINGATTFTLKDDESITFTGIPVGTSYTVTESENDNFTTVATNARGTILADISYEEEGEQKTKPAQTAEFTNTLKFVEKVREDVTLAKVTTGTTAGTEEDEYTIRAALNGLTPNLEYVIDIAHSDDSADTVRFTTGATGSANVTLTLKTGDKAVFKQLDVGSTYQFIEAEGFYISSYRLTNSGSEGSIAQSTGENTARYQTLATALETVDEKENVTVTFTNELSYSQNLSIHKKVVQSINTKATNQAAGAFKFAIHFTDLPIGARILSNRGVLTADSMGEAELDNFTIKDGETVTFTGVPAGASYVVTEKANDYRASYTIEDTSENILYDADGNEAKGENTSIHKDIKTSNAPVISRHVDQVVNVTNDQMIAPVEISKTIEGNAKEQDKAFDFTLTIKDLLEDTLSVKASRYNDSGELIETDETLSFTDNATTFTLKGGEKIVLQLPVELGYTLTENDYWEEGYFTSYKAGTASVQQGRKIESTVYADESRNKIAFTNTRNMYPITFRKTDASENELSDANFTLTRMVNTQKASTGDYSQMQMTIGSETKTLPVGDYKLVETKAPDGYIVLVNEIYFRVKDDGKVVLLELDSEQNDFNELSETTTGYAKVTAPTGSDESYKVQIINQAGKALPNTGGPGRLPYALSGIALISFAALMYGFTMRRRERGSK